jgi:hypothetical protein
MNLSIFIAAIALVESGNNPAAVGKAGELSEYQITRQVWKAYTGEQFTKANGKRRNVSRYVAERHAAELEKKAQELLIAQYEHVIVIRVAAGWHRGEAYMRKPWKDWSAETRDYADRVWNVYQDLQRINTLPPAR